MSASEDFTTVPIDERDWTPQEWRIRKHISKSTHLKMKKAGLDLETDANELESLIRGLTDHLTEAEKRIYEIEQELTARAEAEAEAESLLKQAGAAHLNTTLTP